MQNIIQIENLSHNYGSKKIYENLSLNIEEYSVFGVLGKNGVGKSTLINILMGYIKPKSGVCKIFGEDSSTLSPSAKRDIALLFENFITYDFMDIQTIERFFAAFYPKWKREYFYELVDLMGLKYTQKLGTLSFGQKSQVVLGLVFAQDARLLILDDYSMGLDVGYRRLFVDYLKNYIWDSQKNIRKTIILTSHIMGDLVGLIDRMIIVQKGGLVYKESMGYFLEHFKCYKIEKTQNLDSYKFAQCEKYKDFNYIYTFENYEDLEVVECDFESKFLGFVGKY
ncbi:ABC transporter ATP-binding protein [Helicobacter sp. 16-1353]|nr:ABC transporter ATP-binding protein [Helicobacter sp. 16-1353]